MSVTRNKEISPVLTLIGAGPGDPDLISVKGAKALSKARVVLYDALIHPDLLNYVPEKSIKIFVGKRSGFKSYSQFEINNLIVKYALEYGSVVRLKGGDPFVFGRGKEEMKYAAKYGIRSEIIPGMTSATALPALQGISLTARGINESFWVLTGTTRSGKLSSDLHLAARSTATVVVLMGRNKLAEIASIYKLIGRENIPIAVIQDGSLPTEKVALGSIKTIEEVVVRKSIGTPAIIVIGEVVNHYRAHVFQHIENRILQEYTTN